MPNWCENVLTITHEDADVVDNLMAQVRAGDGDLFKYIKPMPEDTFHGNLGDDERKMCEEKGIPNWYDWSCDNWGTKWDAAHLDYTQHDDNSVSFNFNSAWSPPIGVYHELMAQGFEVEAYYVEYGMMFAGEWQCDADGEVTGVHLDNIDESDIPSELDEAMGITDTLAMWQDEDEEEEWPIDRADD